MNSVAEIKFDKKIKRFIKALQIALDEAELPLQWDIEHLVELFGIEEEDYDRISRENNERMKILIDNYFKKHWVSVFKKTFEEEGFQFIVNLLELSIRGNPIETFEILVDNCHLLESLNNEGTSNLALRYLEDYSSTHSLEEIVNNYSIVFHSMFRDEVINAIKRGTKKNPNIKDSYISCFFGEPKIPQEHMR